MKKDKRNELYNALDRLRAWSSDNDEIYDFIVKKQSYFGIPNCEMWKIKKMYCIK
jgi:hypothetical protein